MASISSLSSGCSSSRLATPATILPVDDISPVNPMTNHASLKLSGSSTVLIDHSLSPSGVSNSASNTCLVPCTCSPETTMHPPKALVAVSVGLARPFCAIASAECPILASAIGSSGWPGLMCACRAAPIALDRAADEPNPAAENRSLSTSILRGVPSYWNTRFSM